MKILKKHKKYQINQLIFIENIKKTQEIPAKPANVIDYHKNQNTCPGALQFIENLKIQILYGFDSKVLAQQSPSRLQVDVQRFLQFL